MTGTETSVVGFDETDLDMIRRGDMLGHRLGQRVYDALLAAAPKPQGDDLEPVADDLVERLRDLLTAYDERQTKLHDLLETIREQIRVDVLPDHRPAGLMTNIQNAVYAMRGRTALMDDAAILPAVASALQSLKAERDALQAQWGARPLSMLQVAQMHKDLTAENATLKGEIAELREAARHIMPYIIFTIGDESPGYHPTMPSAVDAFKEAFASQGGK